MSPAANTGHARLEGQRLARFFPDARVLGIGPQIVVGQHEPPGVAQHSRRKPVASRPGADEHEDRVDIHYLTRSVDKRLERDHSPRGRFE